MSLQIRFIITAVLIVVLFCANVVALKLYLYWTYPGLDKVMHVIGGFLAGNLVLIGRYASVQKNHREIANNKYFFVAILGGLIIGLLWEVSEYLLGISQVSPGFTIDTIGDLVMDIAGAILAYITWIKIPHKIT